METIVYAPQNASPSSPLDLTADRAFDGEEFKVGPNQKELGWFKAHRLPGTEVFEASLYGVLSLAPTEPVPAVDEPEPSPKKTRVKSVDPTPES